MEKTKLPGGLTVFLPCFNDARAITKLVETSALIASQSAPDFEILVVDDGSTDGSREILQTLSARLPFMKTVFHEKNLGYGAALRSGFSRASKEFIFYTDGDGQYDPLEIVKLIPLMTEDTGLVNGYKTRRSDSFYRVITGNIYAFLVRIIFDLQVKDPDCDFRLFRKSVLPALESSSGAICVELVKKIQNAGVKIAQVPVTHYPRQYGHSRFFNFTSLFRTFQELAALRRKLRHRGRK